MHGSVERMPSPVQSDDDVDGCVGRSQSESASGQQGAVAAVEEAPSLVPERHHRRNTRAAAHAYNARLEAMCNDAMVVIGDNDMVIAVGWEFRRRGDCMQWEEPTEEEIQQQEEDARAWADGDESDESGAALLGTERGGSGDALSGTDRDDGEDAPLVWDDHG